MIGILSDIHGNATALSAVLTHAHKIGVSELFVLGDLVGYYHQPREVLDQLESWPYVLIAGNHEAMLEMAGDTEVADKVRARYGSSLSIALETLSAQQLKVLLSAPVHKIEERNGYRFFLCHGSPSDPEEYIYPDSPKEVFERCARGADADFILMGHTHHPFAAMSGGKLLLNPGSVGQPRDRSGLAGWATVDPANGAFILRRTPFDVEPVIELARKFDPENEYLIQVLRR